jgi:hypothetical protein
MGPWRPRHRWLPLALVPVVLFAALAMLVGYSLGRPGRAGARPAALGPPLVLVESPRFALPPSTAGNRFDGGWERRRGAGGREALAAVGPAARLQMVNLGEEVERTLTLDLARDSLPAGERPAGERLIVRSGDRELARAAVRADSLPLRVRLPEDLPVGQTPLDLVFERAAPAGGAPPAAAGPAPEQAPVSVPLWPAVYGAGLAPALPPGGARVEGADLVMQGNCLVYLGCRLAGNEALVGTFVPPAGARPGQRFDLCVERPDGTPIRRFHWLPSFWNRLRGARRFELPLRGARGPARVRLISRAGDAGGPAGRWQALGLIDVTGEILTPGQGQ